MSPRSQFAAPAAGGSLGGLVAGSGPAVLLLHGGPGLSFSYLDGLVDELREGFRVATYQQRGLEPSTREGPFTVAQAVEDAVAVLDGLNWAQALVVGHSWGGHLALRLLAAHPDRLLGVLAVDPLGVAGDGGMAAFEAEMLARTPKQARARAQELDDRVMAGRGTPQDALESLEIFWPGYFADPKNAPAMPPIQFSVEAYSGAIGQVTEGLDEITARLSTTDVPIGFVAGAGSPMPWGQASLASAELSPGAFVEVVPGAGHFIWIEAPGRVRQALARLTG
jgi:pimeloyl-ACP methyl ester carboxylesterase